MTSCGRAVPCPQTFSSFGPGGFIVLLSALRKRGYAVSARRDPGDNLIHVQVGPFSSHADAASMRQRLLNDGYNAIIEP